MLGRTWTLPRSTAGHPASENVRSNSAILFSHFKGIPKQVLLGFLLATGYYLASKLGFHLTPQGNPIATFWPPNAVLLAGLLLAPVRRWWILLLAVFPAHLLIQLSTGIPLATSCGWFVTNSAEALLGAACIRRVRNTDELFENVPGVLVYLTFAVVLAPLASSFVDIAVVLTTGFGSGFWKLWTARLFSNMLAAVTVAPTIIVAALHAPRWLQRINRWRILEAVLLATGIIVLSSVVFRIEDPTIPALMFTPLPLVVWVVVRFGTDGLYPSLLAMAIISIWNAAHGRTPFIQPESVLGLQIFLSTIALPMMLLAAVLAERKAVEESLRQSRGRLIDAQEQERRRIARELHDDIGQQLSILQLDIDQLRERSGEALKPSLDKLYQQASATSAATRTISHGLHSAHLEFLGLVPALRNLCQTVAHETSIPVEFTEENIPGNVDPQTALCLYRVTQEALQNVFRHSHAHKAVVQLHGTPERISLRIVDDGVGIANEREHPVALGLASMRERVNFIGGTFKLDSERMRGTRIEASVPFNASQILKPGKELHP